MKNRIRRTLRTSLLATVMLVTSSGLTTIEAAGATTITKLPPPVWTNATVAGNGGEIVEGPLEVPSKNLIYLHTRENYATQTKIWLVDKVKALDSNTGKVKWSAQFTDPGTSMFREASYYLVSPDGTVYVTFNNNNDGTHIYAVGSDGKRKWKTVLSTQEGRLALLQNGSLLFIGSGKMDKNGNYVGGSLTLIDRNGRKVKNKAYTGTVEAEHNRVIIQTNTNARSTGPRIEVFDMSLNKVFSYQVPADAYAETGYNTVLNDGTVILRMNLNKTGNRLIGFSPSGKLLWGRNVEGNAEIAPLGNNYGVFADNKLSVYSINGLLKSAIVNDSTEAFTSLWQIPDGSVGLDFPGSGFYVLDQRTLAPLFTFKLPNDVFFTYSGKNTGYTITETGVSKYKL